jgi:ArsR family metal-binding transcriptional regulator
MLLNGYDLEITTMACDCHAASLAVFAHLHDDIAAALPYLNGLLSGAVYDQQFQVLTWKEEGREVSLRPRLMAISDVADRDDAAARVGRLAGWVNETWERRESLQPNFKKRVRAPAMAIFRLLPGTNCKQCGCETCWILAAKLSGGSAALDDCPALLADSFAGRRTALRDLLAGAH